MNKDRRKAIAALVTALEAVPDLNDLASQVSDLKDDEQEYFDNMPESMQGGEKGSAAEDAINNLQEAQDQLESAAQAVEEALSYLNSAKGG